MFSKESFSKRLRELRSSHNVPATTLGEAIGVSKSAISRFEHGKDYPHCNTIVALADYFDVSLDYLVGRSDDPTRR